MPHNHLSVNREEKLYEPWSRPKEETDWSEMKRRNGNGSYASDVPALSDLEADPALSAVRD